jgi:hypothetical protein
MASNLGEIDVDRLCAQGDDEYIAEDYRQAITHYDKALKLGEAQLPMDQRIEVRMSIASSLFALGSYGTAAEYDRATLKILEASNEYGISHRDTVCTRYSLGQALTYQGSDQQLEEAVFLYQKNTAVIRADDKDVLLQTRKSLAHILGTKLERYTEAEPIYDILLDDMKFLDPTDRELLDLNHNYAAVLYHLGRYEKSKKLFLYLQTTISLLPCWRERKLGKMSRSVNRYIVGCVKAIDGLDIGSATVSTTREDSPPPPVTGSTTGTATHQSRGALDVTNGNASGSETTSEPDDEGFASMTSSDSGRLFDLPSSANDADRWFHKLRHYSHTLLYNGTPKNSGRKPVRVAILDSGFADNRNGVTVPLARQCFRKIKAGQIFYKDFTGSSRACTDNDAKLHGTWCASFLVQVAPRAELYIANVVQPNKAGQKPGHVAAAICWAIDQKVDIISISFGWESEKPEVEEQINRARQKGILIFAAASNDGDFTPDHGVYPASDHSVYCIYSCRGLGNPSPANPRYTKDAVNFMFPGEFITILEADNSPVKGIERQNGTSFATPIAAGTAAMVLDLVRHELKNSEEVERRLKKYKGMSAIFRAMSGDPRDGGYYHVRPWTLLGERRPIPSPHNAHETHQWYTLMNVLGHLQEFGPYQTPLS